MEPTRMKWYRLTKREAKLLRHVEAHFRDGFTDEGIAASMGWPIEEVQVAVETCIVFGLIEPPEGCEVTHGQVILLGKEVGIDDPLTPEEREEANDNSEDHGSEKRDQ